MNAFVKTTKGNFPNQNFYLAWKGWADTNYEVIKFEEEALEDSSFWINCNRGTPVFAGVTVFDKVLDKLGVIYNKIDTYPTQLYPFMNRTIEKSTIGQVKEVWQTWTEKKFMKPIHQKKFNGLQIKSILDWISLGKVEDSIEVYLTGIVNFESEFRIYIQDGEILEGKHYGGNWTKVPDEGVIKEAIKEFGKFSPCAYALDFGVTDDGKTTLVEFNDATSLGNYGIYHIWYSEMLSARWFEITYNKL
jgi:hypothetical protein